MNGVLCLGLTLTAVGGERAGKRRGAVLTHAHLGFDRLARHGPSAVDPALHLRAACSSSLQTFFLAQQACVVVTAGVGPAGVQAGYGGAGQLHAS